MSAVKNWLELRSRRILARPRFEEAGLGDAGPYLRMRTRNFLIGWALTWCARLGEYTALYPVFEILRVFSFGAYLILIHLGEQALWVLLERSRVELRATSPNDSRAQIQRGMRKLFLAGAIATLGIAYLVSPLNPWSPALYVRLTIAYVVARTFLAIMQTFLHSWAIARGRYYRLPFVSPLLELTAAAAVLALRREGDFLIPYLLFSIGLVFSSILRMAYSWRRIREIWGIELKELWPKFEKKRPQKRIRIPRFAVFATALLAIDFLWVLVLKRWGIATLPALFCTHLASGWAMAYLPDLQRMRQGFARFLLPAFFSKVDRIAWILGAASTLLLFLFGAPVLSLVFHALLIGIRYQIWKSAFTLEPLTVSGARPIAQWLSEFKKKSDHAFTSIRLDRHLPRAQIAQALDSVPDSRWTRAGRREYWILSPSALSPRRWQELLLGSIQFLETDFKERWEKVPTPEAWEWKPFSTFTHEELDPRERSALLSALENGGAHRLRPYSFRIHEGKITAFSRQPTNALAWIKTWWAEQTDGPRGI